MLPWWLSGKESTWWFSRCAYDPWVRKIPLEKKMATYPSILAGRAHGQKSLEGYSPWGQKRVGYDLATCCSVAQSCTSLCHPMDCSTPDFPVLHHHLEFAQTHIHWVADAIQSSSSSVIPFSSCLQSFPASVSFLMSQLFTSSGQSNWASTSASVLPINV